MKVARLLSRLWRQVEVKKEAKESVQPLKDANTGQEVDDATDDALSGM